MGKKISVVLASCLFSVAIHAEDCVIMLHGLASHSVMMKPIALALDLQPEYRVVNQRYNSYATDISSIAEHVIPKALADCELRDSDRVNFVTHSMGGLLVRSFLENNEISELDAVVMIAPPNQGSEVVDKIRKIYPLEFALGPAGRQLGTGIDQFPASLSLPDFDLGIIAGVKERKLFSPKILPGQDDGAVSLNSTQLATMTDFHQIEATHSGILFDPETIEQTLSFLSYRTFNPSNFSCSSGSQEGQERIGPAD